MSNVYVMDHPLIQHKIGLLRREETGSRDFRALVGEIAMLMCYEATRDLKLEDVKITTPICETTAKQLEGKKLAIVPILRAGIGMVEGMLALIPAAKVGHIGLYRDPETLEPVEYYCKLPADCDEGGLRGGPDAGYRRLLRGGHRAFEGKGSKEDPFPVYHRRARGRGEDAQRAPGCRPLHRSPGRPSERPRLHCARPWRCGRPYFRDKIGELDVRGAEQEAFLWRIREKII